MGLSYFIQYCTLLGPTDDYKRAMSILHYTYGRSQVIAGSDIEKLVNWTQIKANDLDSLSELLFDMPKFEITLSE